MPTTQASTTNQPTWHGRAILTEPAPLPFNFCAFLEGTDFHTFAYPMAYGMSEEQAIDNLIETLEEAAHRCPMCDSANTSIEDVDFMERETGYRVSEMLHCLDCGAREECESLSASLLRKPAAQAKAALPEVAA